MTNQFTDEQIEAACVAYEYINYLIAALRERAVSDSPAHTLMREAADALMREAADALEAAAGVAPQAPSERTPEFESREQELFKHQPVLSMKDGGIAGCKCIDRVFYNQTEDWGTHLAEVFDALAAPVQPSSTVDEGKLEALIDRLDPEQRATSAALAKGIAEWLGGEKS